MIPLKISSVQQKYENEQKIITGHTFYQTHGDPDNIMVNLHKSVPSVTSPKEVKASFKDFSSTDHDKPNKPTTTHTQTL